MRSKTCVAAFCASSRALLLRGGGWERAFFGCTNELDCNLIAPFSVVSLMQQLQQQQQLPLLQWHASVRAAEPGTSSDTCTSSSNFRGAASNVWMKSIEKEWHQERKCSVANSFVFSPNWLFSEMPVNSCSVGWNAWVDDRGPSWVLLHSKQTATIFTA